MPHDISFGRYLQQCRRALDLTQAELAQRVGCATVTIRKIELEERRPSKEIAERLAAVLAVPAEERVAFLAFARGETATQIPALPPRVPPPVPDRGRHAPRTNLPLPATPLIGREHELVAVGALLQRPDVRLVTLTGPGGVGKTRLALQVAAQLLGAFADGVWFVDLAPLRDPALVAATIAATLGVPDASGQPIGERLMAAVRDKQQVLLVLDNLEHLLAAAPLVADLLQVAPGLKVLATSRVLLHVYGEHTFLVPPLAVPDRTQVAEPMHGLQAAAVRLFLDRAHAVKQDFTLDRETLEAVVAICQHLDGLPLAIELAAARSRLLPPPVLLTRLSNRLSVLTGGARTMPARQQTLRDTLVWSYDLLNVAEQTLVRRLAVFVGGWTLEAAEAVCQAGGDVPIAVLDGLQALLDQSLIQQQGDLVGEPRFRMLETVREYALEQLQAHGEAEGLQRQHAAYYLAFVERVGPEVHGPQQRVWLERLEAEQPNLRAALAWCLAQDERWDWGTRLAIALWEFWERRGGYLSEGRRWLADALAQLERHRDDPDACRLRANALFGLGMLASLQANFRVSQALIEESLELFRALGDTWGIPRALKALGVLASEQGDVRRGITLAEEGLDLARATNDRWNIGHTLHVLGSRWRVHGDDEQAITLLEEGLVYLREVGDFWMIAGVLNQLGILAARCGDRRRAATLLAESLVLTRETGGTSSIVRRLEGFAALAALYASGPKDAARAARLCGAAAALRTTLGSVTWTSERAALDHTVAAVRRQLDAAAFTAAWAEGQAMTLEQAVAYALAADDAAPAAVPEEPPPGSQQGALTPREHEVAALVARGLTNRQIAAELRIARRTVDAHVSTILHKLGLSSRDQIADDVTHR